MSAVINPTSKAGVAPRVLVVDDEPGLLELVTDVVGRGGRYHLRTAGDLASARQILENEQIDLLLVDLALPDGDGLSLLNNLYRRQPNASAVVITGNPSVSRTITAMRAGAVDILPKPFTADHLLERINIALAGQEEVIRGKTRMARLRGAVKKLNSSRHNISKKVDLLCNDLVAAYGELSRQIDSVRTQESFRKLLAQATDLEQLLCHAMDWILRHVGYCNVAVWLASEQGSFELGAYMKYTIPGEQALTDAMRNGLVPLIAKEGQVHLFGPEVNENLTPLESKMLAGQEIVGVNCTYLGESLAAIAMFRDEKSPFTDEDIAMIRAISPIFAVTLAGIVRASQGDHGTEGNEGSEGGEDNGPLMDDDRDREKGKGKIDSADWWKRGEPPPF